MTPRKEETKELTDEIPKKTGLDVVGIHTSESFSVSIEEVVSQRSDIYGDLKIPCLKKGLKTLLTM